MSNYQNDSQIALIGINSVKVDKDMADRRKVVFGLGVNKRGDNEGVSQVDELIGALTKVKEMGLNQCRLDYRIEERTNNRTGNKFHAAFLMVLKPGENPFGGNNNQASSSGGSNPSDAF